jgi:diaminohydroxyphosphoribosylaminopyrimidine deaminase / 5-amino-6-(5-phosphoribosylamino)uracil reductase
VLTCGDGPHVDLALALQQLGERDIASILLEGGGRLSGAMLEQRLVNKMILFYAPKIIGGAGAPANFSFAGFDKMQDAITLDRLHVERFGDDICLTGYPHYVRE